MEMTGGNPPLPEAIPDQTPTARSTEEISMAAARTSGSLSWDRHLAHYLNQVRNFSLLELEEEMALARRWHQHKEKAAADRLVTSHLRLVVKIAAGYRGYG